MSENSLTVLFSEIYDDLCTKFNISKIADFYFREGDYFEEGCKCCHCHFNFEAWFLYWKEIGSELRVIKVPVMVDVIKNKYDGINSNPIKMPVSEYPNLEKVKSEQTIQDAIVAMTTKIWSLREQTDESWDKNRIVY